MFKKADFRLDLQSQLKQRGTKSLRMLLLSLHKN